MEEDDSAGTGALRGAHGVQRHEELPEERHREVHGIDRHAVRTKRERVHSFDETVYMLQIPTDKPT
jgi:hypothetical protein